MYVIFNLDGSIKEQRINEFIQQGNNEENQIQVAIAGRMSNAYTMEIRCKLPNDEVVCFTTFDTTIITDSQGNTYEGYTFLIPDTVTALPGIVRVNIVCLTDGSYKKLVTYSYYLSINEGQDSGVAAIISEQEYYNLVRRIGGQVVVNETILTLDNLPISILDFELGQIIFIKSTNTFYKKVENDLTPIFDFDNHYTKNQIDAMLSLLATKTQVEAITDLIPNQATPQNQLADKDFVNSSIASATGTFRGTYNIVTDLGLTVAATEAEISAAIISKLENLGIVADNNDYVFVGYPNATVSTEYDKFDRYKYVENEEEWQYEYTLNNSSFTAEQWAAISSGITANKVSDYDSHIADTNNPHSVTKAQIGLGNVDNTSDATKKTNFTGSIASGNTGFATGGDVYTELALKADKTEIPKLYLHVIKCSVVVNSATTTFTFSFYSHYATACTSKEDVVKLVNGPQESGFPVRPLFSATQVGAYGPGDFIRAVVYVSKYQLLGSYSGFFKIDWWKTDGTKGRVNDSGGNDVSFVSDTVYEQKDTI